MICGSVEMRFERGHRTIWISYSENPAEKDELDTLVSQTRIICAMSERTGLRVLRSFPIKQGICVLSYLGPKLKVSEKEKRDACRSARKEIERRLI